MERIILNNYFTRTFEQKLLNIYTAHKMKCMPKIIKTFKPLLEQLTQETKDQFNVSSVTAFKRTVLNPLISVREAVQLKKKRMGIRDHRMLQKRLTKCSNLYEFMMCIPPGQRHVLMSKASQSLEIPLNEQRDHKSVRGLVLAEVPFGGRVADAIGIFIKDLKVWLVILEYKTSAIIDIRKYKRLSETVGKGIGLSNGNGKCKESNLIWGHWYQAKDTALKAQKAILCMRKYIERRLELNPRFAVSLENIHLDCFVWACCKRKQVRNTIFHVLKAEISNFNVCLLKRINRRLPRNVVYLSIAELLRNKECSPGNLKIASSIAKRERLRIQDNLKKKLSPGKNVPIQTDQ